MIAAVFLKEMFNIEDIEIIEGEGYDQDIVMNIPSTVEAPQIINNFQPISRRNSPQIIYRNVTTNKNFRTYFVDKTLQNIPGITRKIYFKIVDNGRLDSQAIHFTCFSTSELNTPLFFSDISRNNNNKNEEQKDEYNCLFLKKYFFEPLSILKNSKDESTYFEGLFNLFVIHDGQLVNFKTSSLMNMFRVEEISIASFHQVLYWNTDKNYKHFMELDLNQNGYSCHFDNVLKNLPDFNKKLFDNDNIKYLNTKYIENIKKFGLNILHDMPINMPINNPETRFIQNLYMCIFKIYNIFYKSFFLDLWDKFKITDVDFLSKAKNMLTLPDVDVIEVDLTDA
jgi:hypothetical protein